MLFGLFTTISDYLFGHGVCVGIGAYKHPYEESKGIFPNWYKLGQLAGGAKVIVWLPTFTIVLILKKYNSSIFKT
jgi:hypothetical protein